MPAARRLIGELARVTPLLAATALAGCAPVGPNFLKPGGDRLARIQGDQGLEGRDAPRERTQGRLVGGVPRSGAEPSRGGGGDLQPDGQTDEANYREALALINEARAGLFPTVNGTGSATRSSTAGTVLTAEASGSWTLDVWGQVRREIEAQSAGAESSAANLANALLAEQSALALAYVQVREADSLVDLLTRTVDEYKRSLTITQNQYNAGTAAKSDVITAQAQVLNAQAQLINAGVIRAQSEHAVAVLMGRPPAGLSIPHGPLSTHTPSIPVSLPSALLERRPDIAAAEETMRQDNADIGVAFAGYFPAVSISGLVGYSGNPFAAVRPVQSRLVVRRLARPAAVQWRPDGRSGRGGA